MRYCCLARGCGDLYKRKITMQPQQLGILIEASELVKPGGRLVYATCSLLEEENQVVVAQFLARDARFAIDPLPRVNDDATQAALGGVDQAPVSYTHPRQPTIQPVTYSVSRVSYHT